MSRGGFGFGMHASVAACAIVWASPALAKGERRIDIRAQPASSGIPALAHQADIQVLVSESATRGKWTKAVRGTMTPATALSRLLSGTGLSVAKSDGRTYTLGATMQLASLATAQPVGDEDAPPDASKTDDDPTIVVTGSRIRGAPVASDVITLDRKAIVDAGQVDLGEALRSLPQNFGGGQNPGVGSGAGLINQNLNSASSANLRGLGPDATLTLLNSHRLPYDGAFSGVDISAIPVAAIDRIEVVPDGASALYGSDAVAGVINVILRRDVEGVTTSAQIGASTDGGYSRQQADVVAGKTWAGGGLLVAYDFMRSTDIEADERSYTRSLEPKTSLYPSQNRHAITLAGFQDLGRGVTAKLDAFYSKRKSVTENASSTTRFLRDPEVESYTLAPSLEVPLGSGWDGKVLGVYGRNRTHYSTTIIPTTGPANTFDGCYCNSVTSVDVGAEGPLFALGGGSARLAVGGGFRRNRLDYTQNANGTLTRSFDRQRRSRYAYGEIYLPFVSPDLQIRGVHRLSVSGAVRYEDYPGLDRLATPRVGLIYAPTRSLTMRSSWARSFKAPTLYQQYISSEAYLFPAAWFGLGSASDTVFYASGGNPDVKPERAKSWTAGIEVRPASVPNLTLSATWFDIRYRDRVVQPIVGSISSAFRDPGYASLLDFAPSATELEELIDNAEVGLQNFTNGAFDPASVFVLVDNRNINVASQTIRGVDARLSWTGDIGRSGRLGIDLAGAWLDSKQQLTSDLPEVQLSGAVFSPPKMRGRATISYQTTRLRLSSTVNVTGALVDRRFATGSRLAPSATVDVGASYDLIAGVGKEPRLALSLIVNNVLNNEPGRIGQTGPTDTPYDSTNYSPIGRFVAVGVRRRW